MPSPLPDSSRKEVNPVFTRSLLLSALLIFLVPGFSLAFFGWAEKDLDRSCLEEALMAVSKQKSVPDEARRAWSEFYREHPVSEMMIAETPEAWAIRKTFSEAELRYTTFRWAKWGSIALLATAFVILGPLLAAIFLARRSQAAFYRSLCHGWWMLRGLALVEVLGQAVLIGLLSFWLTVVLTESYSLKLVAICGLAALLAVAALLAAIFAKLPRLQEVTGQMLTEDAAPALWERVRHMAQRLGTAVPDRIIAGIDANFFVTQHPVSLNNEALTGRTLFVSLPPPEDPDSHGGGCSAGA